MLRGFYTAASGMWTQEKKLNNIANNLGNVSTVGYKRDRLVLGTFGEHIALRMNAYQDAGYGNIGDSVFMQVVDSKYTDWSQGTGFDQTTRPLDMSIQGDGYFVIAGEDGEEYLTRDGQFSIDEEGYLVLPGFGRVLGENGEIAMPTSQIEVDSSGGLYSRNEDGESELIDRLMIGIPDDPTTLRKVQDSLFASDGYTAAAAGETRVRQYYLERSNVNLSNEMTHMIASQRGLQSCSQLLKMYDEMAEQVATRISRV